MCPLSAMISRVGRGSNVGDNVGEVVMGDKTPLVLERLTRL
jgi:hypothetical protein